VNGQNHIREHLNDLKLPPLGLAYVERVASTAPSRAVKSNGHNVVVKFPSRKMASTIQAESHGCELALVYYLEHDPDAVAYWDQPEPIKISYISGTGRRISTMITCDFLVMRKSGVELIEAKPAEAMSDLAFAMPNRFVCQPDGKWHSPPAEAAAAEYGFTFRVWTTSELNPVWLQNIVFLGDYFSVDATTIPSSLRNKIIAIAEESPNGISLSDLRSRCPEMTADQMFSLIALETVYFDLKLAPLTDQTRARIFRSKEFAEVSAIISAQTSPPGGQDVINPIPESACVLAKKAAERFALADRKSLNHAIHAYRILTDESYSAQHPTPPRTLRSWRKRYRDGQLTFGPSCGILGLLPDYHKRGNHNPRFPEEMIALVDEVIDKEYATPTRPNRRYTYDQLSLSLEGKYPLPSRSWFYQRISDRSKHSDMKARQGKRAAYAYEFYTPGHPNTNHGAFPWGLCHIDHTLCDVELVCSQTGQNLGRPWLTVLMDGFSRKVLATMLTFDAPSYRTLMMLLRDCVERHERLPHCLVTDNGKEFHSTYFEQLCAVYDVILKRRPPAKARFGSIIERIFGTINTQFLHTLPGNTQNTRNVRQMTKSMDPRGLATLTLEQLSSDLNHFAYEIYNNRPHGTLLVSPQQKWKEGIEAFGARQHRTVKNDESFRLLTLPSTSKGTAKIQPGKGVKIRSVNYWADQMRSPKYEGKSVAVKYDPENMGVAWAYLDQWVRCRAGTHLNLEGRSEKEIKLATKEFRQSKTLLPYSQANSNKQLAVFLHRAHENNVVAQQQAKDGALKNAKNHGRALVQPIVEATAPVVDQVETNISTAVEPIAPTATADYGDF